MKLFPFKPHRRSELDQVAADDDHFVLYPTHTIDDGDLIVGYASVCATPIVNVWLHSKKVKALNSFRLLSTLEGALRMQGLKEYIMPCSRISPFFPNMERLGYSVLGENVWFHKDLNKD